MTATLSAVLLVEDDDGDALLVRECLHEAGLAEGQVIWRRTVADAVVALDLLRPSCVLLDLGLPDAEGLEAVHALIGAEDPAPVVVLTGRHGGVGTEAVALGAQDYLVKDDITPEGLSRTVRYAVERHQAQETELQLREERAVAGENARLERGLLPRPLLRTGAVTCASHYRPGRAHAVLGGDFFDVVEDRHGRVRALIGDVMGHGPDEAALGVSIRVAWRTLVLAGVPDAQVLTSLSRLLEAETDGAIFVTVLDLTIERDGTLTTRVAGHPAPVICDETGCRYLDALVGPPPGVSEGHIRPELWPVTQVRLAPETSVLLFTDGLLDAYRTPQRADSLGMDELLETVGMAMSSHTVVLGEAEVRDEAVVARIVSGAPHNAADDTAIVMLTLGAGRR